VNKLVELEKLLTQAISEFKLWYDCELKNNHFG
jgi:hypothetical protein